MTVSLSTCFVIIKCGSYLAKEGAGHNTVPLGVGKILDQLFELMPKDLSGKWVSGAGKMECVWWEKRQ